MRTIILCLLTALAAFGADVNGTWKASFETQIGTQNYTYELRVAGKTLTGKAISQSGSVEIAEGSVDGDTVKFVENFDYQGMTIRIEYTGKFDGADTIKFSRHVAEFAVEDFAAKRVK